MSETQKDKMSKKEIIKRYILFIISLFIVAVGVAVTKKAELGVSPTSSVANVLSLKFTQLSLGSWLIIWNCLLIVGQILILRKNFQLIQLLQVPLSFLFGYFTDIGMWLVSFLKIDSYIMELLFVIFGTIIIGFGVFLAVVANVIMNSAEAFIKAISDTINKRFGNIKIAFDLSCVVLAVILSVIFFDFSIRGTREGTIIAGVFTGLVVNFFQSKLGATIDRLLT
ncbi:MAG: YitT family protein [Lachnospiraceae bacterium]|nr:YitT family protein [Lachnospiraceae bacterium]